MPGTRANVLAKSALMVPSPLLMSRSTTPGMGLIEAMPAVLMVWLRARVATRVATPRAMLATINSARTQRLAR